MKSLCLSTSILLCCFFSFGDDADFSPSLESKEGFHHFLINIPAPRGLILDNQGNPLAYSQEAKRGALYLKRLKKTETPKEVVAQVEEALAYLECVGIDTIRISKSDIRSHWENRPFFPLSLTEAITPDQMRLLEYGIGENDDAFEFQPFYIRKVPSGEVLSHVTGYVGRAYPEQYVAVGREESLWPPYEGRSGLEKSMDKTLTGKPGVMSVVFDEEGNEVFREVVEPPVPGKTVVTSINLEMQNLANKVLKNSGHNGAFVAVDSETGDILTLASNPGFDPEEFVSGISGARYAELSRDPDAPLFHRAISGEYPPGSTFKPILGLAALSTPNMNPGTHLSGPPAMEIDGKVFRNWNSDHEGYFDVRYALMRSCNTWFYQAAFLTKDEPILSLAHRFGLGYAPNLPLEGVATGNLPAKAPSRRGLANLSIGQGEVLTSPLQMATAMTGFANGTRIALPRLVVQTQDAISPDEPSVFEPKFQSLGVQSMNMNVIREGMWGVVNQGQGTGGRARVDNPQVFGKTGTAQWMNEGEERRLAWFTGFVNASTPKIAFAIVTEGRSGESMSGGRNSGTLAGEVFREVYENPGQFAVTAPSGPANYYASYSVRQPARSVYDRTDDSGVFGNSGRYESYESQRRAQQAQRRSQPRQRRGIFSALFGRRN